MTAINDSWLNQLQLLSEASGGGPGLTGTWKHDAGQRACSPLSHKWELSASSRVYQHAQSCCGPGCFQCASHQVTHHTQPQSFRRLCFQIARIVPTCRILCAGRPHLYCLSEAAEKQKRKLYAAGFWNWLRSPGHGQR